MTHTKHLTAFAAALLLTACSESGVVASTDNIDPVTVASAPPDAAPGVCWDKTVSPAVIETVSRKVLVQPAQISEDGRVQSPPLYTDETVQEVIEPRRDSWYEVPCAADLTPEFIETLQRALTARDFYRGPITGTLDQSTKDAVQQYQMSEGIDATMLSVAGARKLGLIAVKRDITSI